VHRPLSQKAQESQAQVTPGHAPAATAAAALAEAPTLARTPASTPESGWAALEAAWTAVGMVMTVMGLTRPMERVYLIILVMSHTVMIYR